MDNTTAREDSFPEEGVKLQEEKGGPGLGGGGGKNHHLHLHPISAVLSFDLTPSSIIYDDGRWITTWRVKILFVGEEGWGTRGEEDGFTRGFVRVKLFSSFFLFFIGEEGRKVGEEEGFTRGFVRVKRAFKVKT